MEAIAIASLVGGAAQLGLEIDRGEKSRREARRAERRQVEAQSKAEADANAARNRAEADVAKANRKKPDISALLAAAQSGKSLGSASTMLTSGSQSRAKLATPTLLGE